MKPVIAMTFGLVTALLSSSFAFVQAMGDGRIQVSEAAPYGKYLADSEGRTLYMFTKDGKSTSDCYDACAKAWPPLQTSGKPVAGQGLDNAMLGTSQRKDGMAQVTYNGMPLYYFVKDQKPGQVMGQNITAQGGQWYLVSPDGKKNEAK